MKIKPISLHTNHAHYIHFFLESIRKFLDQSTHRLQTESPITLAMRIGGWGEITISFYNFFFGITCPSSPRHRNIQQPCDSTCDHSGSPSHQPASGISSTSIAPPVCIHD